MTTKTTTTNPETTMEISEMTTTKTTTTNPETSKETETVTTTTELKTKVIDGYVKSIRKHLSASNRSWMKIAQTLAKAKNDLEEGSFKTLCKEVKISTSNAYKMVVVAESERIKKYASKLVLIDAWSTLHSITNLTEEEFSDFSKKVLSGKAPVFFTRSDVSRIKENDGTKTKKSNPILATVRLKVEDLNDENLGEVLGALETLSAMGIVEIVQSSLIERLENKAEEEVMREVKKQETAARKAVKKCIKSRKDEIRKETNLKGKALEKEFSLRWGTEKEDLGGTIRDVAGFVDVELDLYPLVGSEVPMYPIPTNPI